MKNLVLVIGIFMASLTVGAAELRCDLELKEMDTCVQVDWKIGPKYGVFCKAEATFFKASDKKTLVDMGEKTIIYPWMVMDKMEHGSRDTSMKKVSTGKYQVNLIQFMKMDGGYWELRVRSKKDNNRTKKFGAMRIKFQ